MNEANMNSNAIVSVFLVFSLSTGGAAFGQGKGNGKGNDRGRDEQSQSGGARDRRDNDDRQSDRRDNDGRQADRRNDEWRQHDGREDRNRGGYQNERRDARDGRGAGPAHTFYRGGRLPVEYRHRHYVVEDWRAYHLSAPPRGYHWVQTGGDFVLIAIATGIIASIFLGQY